MLNKTQMKLKIVGDQTSPDSIPTLNINIIENIKCRGSNIPGLNTNKS